MLKYIFILMLLSPASYADEVTFDKDIRPIFNKYCYKCHTGSRQYNAAYNMRWRLYEKMVVKGQMPPFLEVQPTKSEIELVRQWIETGAKK